LAFRAEATVARHEAVHRWLAVVSALQEPFDFISFANDKAFVAPLNQRRLSEQQAIIGAGKAEIVRPRVAEAPKVILYHSIVPK